MGDIDINTLTMEQYIALIRDNNRSWVVKLEIGNNVDFEIKSHFMKELRRNLFAVFPITLTSSALRWKNRLAARSITTWDLLEKAFIWRYCPPFKTARKSEEIRNFKQGMDEIRAKVTIIKESKDLSSLALDELIGNLKVYEVVMEKDSEIYRGKKERVKSIALKTNKESSDDETLTSESDDEEYDMVVRNFKKFFRRKGKFVRKPREEKKSFRQRDEKKGKSDRKCFRCGDPNHLIGDSSKPPRNNDQKAFIGGSWSDSGNEAEKKLTMKLVSWLNPQMR
nr:zf-CCHC domain-containing protein/DUF4219 domain-containing protein/UBN2 domain-containing protein [Tanacetum cinerariifolium]